MSSSHITKSIVSEVTWVCRSISEYNSIYHIGEYGVQYNSIYQIGEYGVLQCSSLFETNLEESPALEALGGHRVLVMRSYCHKGWTSQVCRYSASTSTSLIVEIVLSSSWSSPLVPQRDPISFKAIEPSFLMIASATVMRIASSIFSNKDSTVPFLQIKIPLLSCEVYEAYIDLYL